MAAASASWCPLCRTDTLRPTTIRHETSIRYEGRDHVVVVPNLAVKQCSTCGEVILDPTTQAPVFAEFRRQVGLLQPEQIRDGLKRLRLKQRDLCRLTGYAPATLSRWLRGDIVHSRPVDNFLRVFFASSEARALLTRLAATPPMTRTPYLRAVDLVGLEAVWDTVLTQGSFIRLTNVSVQPLVVGHVKHVTRPDVTMLPFESAEATARERTGASNVPSQVESTPPESNYAVAA